ncbi:MAG TPA: LLM class flavin-dependent oxidoreductase [Polyangiaceae bacterium]|nr:LLM class flavin-dependent oxidoreductase [Polyangiaceae bacterium]
MSARSSFYWTLPVAGDGPGAARDPEAHPSPSEAFADARRGRFDLYDYLLQVARAARVAGFDGLYVPWDEEGQDPWIATASLARRIDKLLFVPQVQPGFATPVYFAKLAATFRRFAGERLAYALDLSLPVQRRHALADARQNSEFLERAAEFVEATAGVASQTSYDFEGRHFQVQSGGLQAPLGARPPLRVFTSGNGDDLVAFAGAHSDVHLLDWDAEITTSLARLRASADAAGRQVAAGVRATLIARHDEEEAQRVAAEAGTPAHQRRSLIVGSYQQVAQRIDELSALGVEHFVLDASPRLEEAYRFGERVLPLLRHNRPLGQRVA